MQLTPEQLAIREKIMQYSAVIPDPSVSMDTVLLMLILDELQVLRSMVSSVMNPFQPKEEDN
jgi:hypothetical protein